MRIAINKLPPVLLKAHVISTEKLTTASRKTITPETVRPPFAAANVFVKYCGACQPAHMTPRITVPKSGPQRVCRRGSAKPRQPGSSSSGPDRKSTRLNSSHVKISYAVFCLKKKNHSQLACQFTTTTHLSTHHRIISY